MYMYRPAGAGAGTGTGAGTGNRYSWAQATAYPYGCSVYAGFRLPRPDARKPQRTRTTAHDRERVR